MWQVQLPRSCGRHKHGGIVRPLRIGDQLQIWASQRGAGRDGGGRTGTAYCEGTLIDFRSGRRDTRAALVRLTGSHIVAATPRFLVLELSNRGACWAPVGTVDVDLYDAMPGREELRRTKHGRSFGRGLSYELVTRSPRLQGFRLRVRRFVSASLRQR